MKFTILTIFPEVIKVYIESSILQKASKNGAVRFNIVDIRKFANDKHHTVDDRPYGGGPGMVFKPGPTLKAFSTLKINKDKSVIVLLSASGRQFTSSLARGWAFKYGHIILIAGHYEGIDERVKKAIRGSGFKIQEISTGPYVLTGGELPALAVIDAVSRHTKGVLGKRESLEEERFGIGVPVYTRPDTFLYRGRRYSVPMVLLSGHHDKIKKWRRKFSRK